MVSKKGGRKYGTLYEASSGNPKRLHPYEYGDKKGIFGTLYEVHIHQWVVRNL